MRIHGRFTCLIASLACAASVIAPFAFSQSEFPTPEPATQIKTDAAEEGGCIKPAPLFPISDYNGPMKKLIASFARKVEIKTAHSPHYQPGLRICPLDAREKFILFVQNTVEPITFIGAGFNAGISQAANYDAQFGQGASGYGQRFGAALADSASGEFFGTFLFPVIFSQDPRYYRLHEGTTRKRIGHAIGHVFITQNDSGKSAFNYSEWFSVASTIALHNVYHPGNQRGFAPAAARVGITVGTDAAASVLREFWPEISRKLKLPFRAQQEPASAKSLIVHAAVEACDHNHSLPGKADSH